MNNSEYIQLIKNEFGLDAKDVICAYKFAKHKHRGQYRDDGSPYIIHPVRVAELTRENKPSTNAKILYISALLHDTLEDTYTSYKEICNRFDSQVASLVMELSTAKEVPHTLKGGKAEYLSKKMENMTNYALFIKLCDRLDNLRDVAHTNEEKVNRLVRETKTILEYLQQHRPYTQSQQKIVDLINVELKKYH